MLCYYARFAVLVTTDIDVSHVIKYFILHVNVLQTTSSLGPSEQRYC